jgi:hypothetical protein
MRSIYSHKETVAYVFITLGALDNDRSPEHVHCQLLRLYMRFASSRRSEDGAAFHFNVFYSCKRKCSRRGPMVVVISSAMLSSKVKMAQYDTIPKRYPMRLASHLHRLQRNHRAIWASRSVDWASALRLIGSKMLRQVPTGFSFKLLNFSVSLPCHHVPGT